MLGEPRVRPDHAIMKTGRASLYSRRCGDAASGDLSSEAGWAERGRAQRRYLPYLNRLRAERCVSAHTG